MHNIPLSTALGRFSGLLVLLAFAVGAIAAAGDIDATFGNTGTVKFINAAGTNLAFDASRRLTVVYLCENDNLNTCVKRYNADGTPDASFGQNGGVQVPRAIWSWIAPDQSVYLFSFCDINAPIDICPKKVSNDGRVITELRRNFGDGWNGGVSGITAALSNGGFAFVAASRVPGGKPTLKKIDASGNLIVGFGNGGSVELPANIRPTLIHPESDGSTLIAGVSDACNSCPNPRVQNYDTSHVSFRITPLGAIDTSYGARGVAATPIGLTRPGANYGYRGADYFQSAGAIVQRDDKLVLASGCYNGIDSDICISRWNTDGSADLSFGNGGRTFLGAALKTAFILANALISDRTGLLLRQTPDDKLVLGLPCETPQSQPNVAGDCIYRLNPNGSPDSTFGKGGRSLLEGNYTSVAAWDLSIERSGLLFSRHVLELNQTRVDLLTTKIDTVPAADYACDTHNPLGDCDNDGIPNGVEMAAGTFPTIRDNQLFAGTEQGAKLFVMQAYRDFVGREADAAGLAYWSSQVNTTNIWPIFRSTRPAIVEQFVFSPETDATVGQAARLYFAAFERAPDAEGLSFWASELAREASSKSVVVRVASQFAASPEFVARYGAIGNEGFVQRMYLNVLARPADLAGLNFWQRRMSPPESLTRGEVLAEFANSAEFRETSAPSVAVARIYVAMLRRGADQGGLVHWSSELRRIGSAQNLIEQFLNSREYRARFL